MSSDHCKLLQRKEVIVLKRVYICLIGMWFISISFSSCDNGNSGFPPENQTPKRSVGLVIDRGDPQTEQLTIYATPGVLGVGIYGDVNPYHPQLTKLELDFGDGGGWTDVTAWYDANDGTKIKHIYGEAGTYQLNVRATFWDAEVIYLGVTGEPDPPRLITVPES